MPTQKTFVPILLAATITLAVGSRAAAEQDRAPVATSPTSKSVLITTEPTAKEGQPLDQIQRDLTDLKKKLEKPPKDTWDKLTAMSGLISGVIVALIGFYATNVYNRRQKATEDRRKDQELLISQIQTVEKFIPHLSSTNESTKSAALVAIAALGNEELAVKLAKAFGGSGATSALVTIASGGELASAETATIALGDIFKYLQSRVVTTHEREKRRASGFVVSDKGLVVTTAHAVEGIASDQIGVGLPNDVMVRAVLKFVDKARDLALLAAETREPLTPLDLSPTTPKIGEHVVALMVGLAGELRAQVGEVVSMDTKSFIEGQTVSTVGVRLPVEPGASGAPVVDREGRLLGIVQASDMRGTTYLISASDVLAFVAEAERAA